MADDVNQLESEAIELACRAVQFDQEGVLDAAHYYYVEAARTLTRALVQGSTLPNITQKINEYTKRAEELVQLRLSSVCVPEKKNEQQLQLERAEFLLYQALDEDEAGNNSEAVELYGEAVELCLEARKMTEDSTLHKKLTKLAEQALERAEALKSKVTARSPSPVSPAFKPISPRPSRASNVPVIPPLGIGNRNLGRQDVPGDARPRSVSPQAPSGLQVSGSEAYTKEELEVLRLTSLINGREYVPFLMVDLKERFAYPLPFGDHDGKLTLSPKQKAQFSCWARLEEISSIPKIIELIDCFSIKQTIVSDCSFVASLAISALYEKRFKKRLITRIIYPQNRQGEPVYNPCGKYMIKLHINGVPRKVVIDDYLPIRSNGELLCSYSSNKNEFWVSLLEKAYMKVMGGYDFPGSNSNIDLHALTGWIPERIGIKANDSSFDKDKTFRTLYERYRKGDVLVTLATGELGEVEADRAGLVPMHAYAMLDVQEVMGKRLFLLKNPWSHLRWKGNYSERDTLNWTPKFKEALKYDPHNAQMFDNGVFWIDYESVCRFYDVIYLNWNPGLFKYTYCMHQMWKSGAGPIKDQYNIGENPQYSLEIKSPESAVWILLTRHITDRDDFAENKEYIAVVVYKNEGRRVYLPYDPPPYQDGARINSPHFLCKLKPQSGVTRYTLVISQYEKTNTIFYTLRVYSTCPFHLAKLGNPYKYKQEVKNGQWTSATAGGCGNHPATYNLNPVYQITLQSPSDDNDLLIDLKGPKQYQVGFDVITVSVNNPSSLGYFTRKGSGVFRSGFTILELQSVPAGTYNIIPSTFMPGQKGPFFLSVQSSCPIKMARLK